MDEKGNNRAAAVYQYWAVTKTGVDQYDLACYLARLGKVTDAFYWLQVAALEDGVDTAWAEEDGDLAPLRRDARWPAVRQYLAQCSRYWAAHGKAVTVLVTPKNYDGKEPLSTLVWLHGSNTTPDFRVNVQSAVLEAAADELQVAILGVSGPVTFGKAKFSWSEEPERDYRRVKEALDEVKDRVQIKPESVIAVGFSQGGQVAVEIAARHPEVFAGAIALAPGAGQGCQLSKTAPSSLLTQRGFVIVVGKQELPDRLQVAAADVKWLKGARAKLAQVIHAGGHSVPAELRTRLREWMGFIEMARKKAP